MEISKVKTPFLQYISWSYHRRALANENYMEISVDTA